jgi:hypothetical protein
VVSQQGGVPLPSPAVSDTVMATYTVTVTVTTGDGVTKHQLQAVLNDVLGAAGVSLNKLMQREVVLVPIESQCQGEESFCLVQTVAVEEQQAAVESSVYTGWATDHSHGKGLGEDCGYPGGEGGQWEDIQVLEHKVHAGSRRSESVLAVAKSRSDGHYLSIIGVSLGLLMAPLVHRKQMRVVQHLQHLDPLLGAIAEQFLETSGALVGDKQIPLQVGIHPKSCYKGSYNMMSDSRVTDRYD